MISEKEYEEIKSLWGGGRSKTLTRRNHSSSSRASCSDGTKFQGTRVGPTSDVWKSSWDQKDQTRVPFSSKHRYVNKVKASDITVFDLKVISEEEADTLGLFEYPKINNPLDFPTIIGRNVSKETQKKFQRLNAKYGPTNQLRLWILVFKDAPRVFGDYQENYWVSGNKNELVICVSVDKTNQVQWSHYFSWSTTPEVGIQARDKLKEIGVLNEEGWNQYYEYLDEILPNYVRREFAEFDYIKVTPPTWAVILIIVLAIIVSVGINIWVINNEYYDD
jgi:hypothetical protein